jgi:hypothetical protein
MSDQFVNALPIAPASEEAPAVSSRVEIEAALMEGDHRLTAAELEQFHQQAAGAVARRDAAFWQEEGGLAVGRLAFGAIGLIGLFMFGWTPASLFLFLVIGTWLSILGDTLKLRMVRAMVEQWAEQFNQNQQVWLVAEALRNGQPIRRGFTGYAPIGGLFVDYLFATIATAVLLIASRTDMLWVVETFSEPSFLHAIALIAAYEVLATAVTIFRTKRAKDSAAPVKFQAGGRGIGLLLVSGIAVAITSGGVAQLGMTVVVIANLGIILLGLLGVIGMFTLQEETEWLRKRLRRTGGGAGG